MDASLISSRDQSTEQIVLSKILTVGQVPPDIIPEYFQGAEYHLFVDLKNQWDKWGKFDLPLIKSKHRELFFECLDNQGSYSEATIEILHTHWMRRQIGYTLLNIGDCKDPKSTLERIQGEIADIAFSKKTDDYVHLEELQKLQKVIDRGQKENRTVLGYSTGLPELDKLTNGLEKGKVYTIGALKKTCKSQFAIHLALTAAQQGAGIMINSLEMSRMQLNSSALARYSEVNRREIGRKVSEDNYKKLAYGVDSLKHLNWCIYRDHTPSLLRSRILYEKSRRTVDLVAIDYLQRMYLPGRSKISRAEELAEIANEIANMSRELDVCMVEFSQLSGEAERLAADVMPDMKHFKDSQGLVEAADVIMTLHNFKRSEDPYHQDGSYRLQDIHCKVEQRYDVSGLVIKFLGDLRICEFNPGVD